MGIKLKIKKSHRIWLGIGIILIGMSFLFLNSPPFSIILGLGIITCILPFILYTIIESKKESIKEEMFLEFARNLVESVKMGSPISKSIILLKGKSYSALTPHVNKLANQISMGIPLNDALHTFAKDINNKKITRAITLIRQAERAGGNIGEILESVSEAVSMNDKIKRERKSTISTLVVQSYIIFFVFIIIILIMQFQILPMISGIAGIGESGSSIGAATSGADLNQEVISNSFLYLLLIQGLFSGLIIGELAEESIKSGIKHSFILMISAFLIFTISNALFGI